MNKITFVFDKGKQTTQTIKAFAVNNNMSVTEAKLMLQKWLDQRVIDRLPNGTFKVNRIIPALNPTPNRKRS